MIPLRIFHAEPGRSRSGRVCQVDQGASTEARAEEASHWVCLDQPLLAEAATYRYSPNPAMVQLPSKVDAGLVSGETAGTGAAKAADHSPGERDSNQVGRPLVVDHQRQRAAEWNVLHGVVGAWIAGGIGQTARQNVCVRNKVGV